MRRRQGQLALVLIATPLAGCGPSAGDVPQDVMRAHYASREACLQDWRSEAECEALTERDRHGHVYTRWWGPYYTRSGTVYHYDGRTSQQAGTPLNATGIMQQTLTPNQMATQPGRYAATPKGRGGFGGTGRAASGGG